MTRTPLQLKEAFRRGLRSLPDPKNQDRLARCYNAKPMPEGLRGWIEIPQLVTQANTDFPFPQLFVGREKTWLMYETSISEYNIDTGVETSLTTVDAYNTATPKSIVAGGPWHFVDLGKNFIFTNGVCIVFRDNSHLDYSVDGSVKVAQDVVLGTICEWRGVVFSAGFEPSLLWKSTWQTQLEAYRANSRNDDDLLTLDYDLTPGFVLWGTTGRADFSFRWLLYPAEAFTGFLSGTYTVEGTSIDYTAGGKSPLQEALLRTELGALQMPFRGTIKKLMPHTQGVIVYGSDGIALLRHHTEPFSTFGLELISAELGIVGRASVGGDESAHVFVGTDGKLYLLDSSAKLQSLEYGEFFREMLTEEPIVCFNSNPSEPEFYISSGSRGFVLTKAGLGESFQRITSVGTFGGAQGCVSSNREDKSLHLETSDYNGGVEGLKQISTLRLVANTQEGFTGSTLMSYEASQPFVQSRPRALNGQGNLSLTDSAVNFKICLDHPKPQGLLLEQLDVEVAFLDKRFIRSTYGQEADQSTDS